MEDKNKHCKEIKLTEEDFKDVIEESLKDIF